MKPLELKDFLQYRYLSGLTWAPGRRGRPPPGFLKLPRPPAAGSYPKSTVCEPHINRM